MKNPNWHRDEIILALYLYYNLENKEIDKKNLKIIALSELLKKLPIHNKENKNSKFRNPNGVALKLNNFKAIDPLYNGKGMSRGSQLDKKVFFEFKDNKQSLKKIAEKIKDTVKNLKVLNELYKIGDEEDDVLEVKEGKTIYKLHKYRERDSKLNAKKKKKYFKEKGKLDCEVCGFDFHVIYGELGFEFIECHHKIPLGEIEGETTTTLEDLALVCSNCHRMLHRGEKVLSIMELQKIIEKHSSFIKP